MKRTRRTKPSLKTPARETAVSAADRTATRRSLAGLKTPTEVMSMARGSQIEFFSVLHMVEMLMDIGRPLSAALREPLKPWTAELVQRRERLLADNRRADARLRNPSSTEPNAGTR